MIFILIAILLGSFLSLTLMAPSEYFLMLIILPLIGFFIIFIFKESIKKPSKSILITLPFVIILSYLATSYITFKPKNVDLINTQKDSPSKNKNAIILYADGEMEKYIPYFAGHNITNVPYILKPIESYKIKKAYESIEISKKNLDILKIASDFRESLLKNSPSYFYISYVNYTPSLYESINSALKDGCKDISVLNFSNTNDATQHIDSIKETLKSQNIKLNVSQPILKNLSPEFVLRDLPPDISKFNQVLILDNSATSLNIKQAIVQKGVNEQSILLSNDVKEGFNLLDNSNSEFKNVLVINLLDFNNGILEKYSLQKEISKHENIDFEVLNPLKYNKDFLEIIVNEYKSIKKQP